MTKHCAIDYKVIRHHNMARVCAAGRLLCLTVATAVASAGATVEAETAGARHGQVAISCINPTVGEPFEITIDYDRATVDSHPARISETQIAWYNPGNGRSYTLDRRSGALTGVFPSSTGGVIFHDRCKLDN
jgi:hypothetical protein